MNEFRFRRIPVIVALTVAGLVWPAAALQAGDFRVSGTDETTFTKGNQGEGISAGLAQPGGQFTGVWSGRFKGYTISGVESWDFGGGHTLTWFFEIEYSNKNLISTGAYVVIDGTGRFAGASGSADYVRMGHGDGTGEFVLEGTLLVP